MLKEGISLSDSQLDFIIKTVLIVVGKNYADDYYEPSRVEPIRELFKNGFLNRDFKTEEEIDDFALEASKMLNPDKQGYSIFAINLIIKRLAPMLDESEWHLFGASLNKEELGLMNSQAKRIAEIKESNYRSVMGLARDFAKKQGAESLYEWELNAYNRA